MALGLSILLLLAGELATPTPGAASWSLAEDPLLRDLVRQTLDRRPELAQGRAQIAAERERVPQTRALPDPMLSLGIQNDRFGAIEIGKMETSFIFITASQTFPWVGKRGLRAEVAGLGARSAEADLQRALLSAAADVERAYVDLLRVRGEQDLLIKLETLWTQSEGLTRARYEVGEAPQSDLLRAQLQRIRLRQQRWALQGEEGRQVAVLNRLRGLPMDTPIATTQKLVDLSDPPLPEPEQAATTAESASPELKKALLLEQQAGRRVELANKELWPDLTVNAGVMPRWGNFPTMWQAGLSINLPVWSSQKQSRAVAESRAREEMAGSGAAAVRQLVRQRAYERVAALGPLLQANRLYRSGLLVQSDATVASTLTQYQVGSIAFTAVLDALAGYLSDMKGFLDSVAAAHQIAIAESEVSLAPPGGPIAGEIVAPAVAVPSAGSNPGM